MLELPRKGHLAIERRSGGDKCAKIATHMAPQRTKKRENPSSSLVAERPLRPQGKSNRRH